MPSDEQRDEPRRHPEVCTCGCGWLMHAIYEDDLDRYLVGGCSLHASCLHWEPQ